MRNARARGEELPPIDWIPVAEAPVLPLLPVPTAIETEGAPAWRCHDAALRALDLQTPDGRAAALAGELA